MKKIIRLGTRGSPLALVQAEEIRRRLFDAHPGLSGETEIEIVPIRTSGDWKPEQKDRRFVDMGGNKGMFTKEIEEALLGGHIDMAVHSLKDVASSLSPQLDLAAVIQRGDARDAFICAKAKTLAELPAGAVIGTSSLRRQAQILAQRPDLRVVPLRGNVETRLKKLESGLADATILAVAGMARLGVDNKIASILPVATMLPPAGQGALSVEIRSEDRAARDLLTALDHAETRICATAERAVMRAIDGTCHTPAGAYATLVKGKISLDALVARANGGDLIRLTASGDAKDADALGEALGRDLRRNSPADLFAA